jgi:hypothetical protein
MTHGARRDKNSISRQNLQAQSFDEFRRTLFIPFPGTLEKGFSCTIEAEKEVRCMYERLLALGFTEQMARDILVLFSEPDELRTYVFFAELLHV